MKINLLTNINWKEKPERFTSSTGNHTVTNVHKRESVMIFNNPKSFILFLFVKGKKGNEYKKEIAPNPNKKIKCLR